MSGGKNVDAARPRVIWPAVSALGLTVMSAGLVLAKAPGLLAASGTFVALPLTVIAVRSWRAGGSEQDDGDSPCCERKEDVGGGAPRG